MADDGTTPQTTQKQAPTSSTYTRATITTASTVTLPFAFQQAFAFLGGIVHDIWPNIREPSDGQTLALGILITGIPTFWAAFSIRGTEVKQ